MSHNDPISEEATGKYRAQVTYWNNNQDPAEGAAWWGEYANLKEAQYQATRRAAGAEREYDNVETRVCSMSMNDDGVWEDDDSQASWLMDDDGDWYR